MTDCFHSVPYKVINPYVRERERDACIVATSYVDVRNRVYILKTNLFIFSQSRGGLVIFCLFTSQSHKKKSKTVLVTFYKVRAVYFFVCIIKIW